MSQVKVSHEFIAILLKRVDRLERAFIKVFGSSDLSQDLYDIETEMGMDGRHSSGIPHDDYWLTKAMEMFPEQTEETDYP